MEIINTIKNSLEGEALANALDLVGYLTAKDLTPHMEWASGCRFTKNGKSPCLVFMIGKENGGGWVICDLPVVSEPEWNSLSDGLKEFIVANIKICSVHQGESCGCGSEPGTSKNIFGKVYDNVCTSEIQIVNPGAKDLDAFKEIVEWWVIHIGAQK
jgi:hypothetical protein